MKKRTFAVYSTVSEHNFSGLSQTKMTYLTTIPNVLPTVKEIRSLVSSFFPEYEIEETWATLAEQIRSNLDIGMISVSFKTNDEFITHGCTLEEVF